MLFISREFSCNWAWDLGRWVQWGTDYLWHTWSLPRTPGCSEHVGTPVHPRAPDQMHRTSMAHLPSAQTRAASRASESHDREAAVTKSSVWKLPGQTSQLEKKRRCRKHGLRVSLIKLKLKSCVFLDKAECYQRRNQISSQCLYPFLTLSYRHLPLCRTTPGQNTGVLYNGYVVPCNCLGFKHTPVTGLWIHSVVSNLCQCVIQWDTQVCA